MDVGPPGKLVQVRADAGELADALLFQRRLPQAVVQGALPDEVGYGLALGCGLGGDDCFFIGRDAQLYPCRAGVLLRLHGVGLFAFAGVEGAQPLASPRKWTPRSVCPQRVGWLSSIRAGG